MSRVNLEDCSPSKTRGASSGVQIKERPTPIRIEEKQIGGKTVQVKILAEADPTKT